MIHDPFEAGELCADYIAARREHCENALVTLRRSSQMEGFEVIFELWERDFWRILALEGVEEVKRQIALFKKGKHGR